MKFNIKAIQTMKGSIRQALVLLLLVSMTAACSKKQNSTQSTTRYTRGTGYQNGFVNPQTGQTLPANSQWGSIFNLQNLNVFMSGATDLGFVSPNQNDSTGIRFRGSVKAGTFQMLVWDSVASQTGQAYFWNLSVTDAHIENGYAAIVLSDSVGGIFLSGPIQNGTWSGEVNFGQDYMPLGNFTISSAALQ
jgi:hypothetical protein